MVDGVTAKRATWPWRMAAGARYASSMKNITVSIRVGEREIAVAFGRSAGMIVDDVSKVMDLKKSEGLVGRKTCRQKNAEAEVMRALPTHKTYTCFWARSGPSEAHNAAAEVVVVICYLIDAIVLSYFRSKALLFYYFRRGFGPSRSESRNAMAGECHARYVETAMQQTDVPTSPSG